MNLVKFVLVKTIKENIFTIVTTPLFFLATIISGILLVFLHLGFGMTGNVGIMIKCATLANFLVSLVCTLEGVISITWVYVIKYKYYREGLIGNALWLLRSYAHNYMVDKGDDPIITWEFKEQLRSVVFAYDIPLERATKYLHSKNIPFYYEISADWPNVNIKR